MNEQNAHEQKCGAKTRSGGRCKRAPAPGYNRCNLHGGKTPRGHALPHTKTGRYSKHLPTRMAARYLEAETDGELISLRSDVALLDARIADLLARVDSGESGRIWSDTKAAFEALRKANREHDTAKATEALFELDRLITRGQTDYATWAEVVNLVEQRRRTVDSERKHLQQMGQLVAVEQMMVLAGALLASVKQHVSDRDTLQLITTDFTRLTEVS